MTLTKSIETISKLIGGITIILGALWTVYALADKINDTAKKVDEVEKAYLSHVQEVRLDDLNAKIRALEIIPEDEREGWQKEQLLFYKQEKEKLLNGVTQ